MDAAQGCASAAKGMDAGSGRIYSLSQPPLRATQQALPNSFKTKNTGDKKILTSSTSWLSDKVLRCL